MPDRRTALITGVGGQDGFHLAHLLARKGYRVAGASRRPTLGNMVRDLPAGMEFKQLNLLEQGALLQLVEETSPDEIYNLAGMSFVPTSWQQPSLTADCNGLGVIRLLEAVRRKSPQARFFQASSSRMYGPRSGSVIREDSVFDPVCPYGSSKVFGHCAAVNYREGHHLFVCCGILFNHESPRRAPLFVTRKITMAAARIAAARGDKLRLGNLQDKRDWSYAGDVARAMWLSLQAGSPDDYVIGSGELHSVQEFVETAFTRVGLDWRDHVVQEPALFRKEDTESLRADISKARSQLGWAPSLSFGELVGLMVDADLDAIRRGVEE